MRVTILLLVAIAIMCGCASPWVADFVVEKNADGTERRTLRVTHRGDNSYSGDYIPVSSIKSVAVERPVVVQPVQKPVEKMSLRESRLLRIWQATFFFVRSSRWREARSGAQALAMIFGDLMRRGTRSLDDDSASDRVSDNSNAARSIDDVIAAGEAGFKELGSAPVDNKDD